MDIDLNENIFCFSDPIKLNYISKDNNKTIKYIKFSTDINSIKSSSNSLFSTIKIDKEYISKTINKTIKIDDKSFELIYVPNIILLRAISLQNLIYILAFILKVNISEIDVKCFNIDLLNPKDKEKIENYEFIYQTQFEQKNEYNSMISIGNSIITVDITSNSDANKYVNYDEYFYPDYYNILNYTKKLLESNLKKIHIIPTVKNMIVSLIYGDINSTISDINIAKLFNLLHISDKIRKITIHDDSIDEFKATPRAMQYAKSPINASNPFKGTASRFNTICIYFGIEIDKSITLSRIEINKNSTIHCIFTITNISLSYEHIRNSITDFYINGKFWILLKNVRINEVVMDLNFDINKYIPIYNGVTISTLYSGIKASDFEKISLLANQEIPNIKYRTKTSIDLNMYGFNDIGVYYKYLYIINFHEFVTKITLQKDLLPTLHVSEYTKNSISISINGAFSFKEALFNICMIIPLFKHSDSQNIFTLKTDISVDSIREKCKSIPTKTLLKTLEETDPVLFGPRKVKNKQRPYSGLAQKNEQRVVPITMDEYEYLKTKMPESVVNLQNQHNSTQRLYLFCPYKNFSYLNFHHLNGQLCVPKCTIKQSNKSQHSFCSEQLDSENKISFSNKFENQTITLYNPLISPGRRCKVPPELINILINFILLKLNITINIYNYIETTYEKEPFIIKRDIKNNIYNILTEYNKNTDYILILQSEIDEKYFIFLDESTNEPLIFSKNMEIRTFFEANSIKTNVQYNFFNYIEKILKTNLNQYYDLPLKEIINIIINKYKIKFIIHSTFIYGIIYDKVLWITPKFYWVFNESDLNTELIYKSFEKIKLNIYTFPDISKLDIKAISTAYISYNTEKISMVNYYGNSLPIIPISKSEKYSHIRSIIYDDESLIENYLNINYEKKSNIKEKQILQLNVEQILNMYIFIYSNLESDLNVEKIKEELKKLNIVYKDNTFISYTPYQSYVSWRSSKISESDFDNYMNRFIEKGITTKELISILYNQFQNELKFKVISNIEQLESKIITL